MSPIDELVAKAEIADVMKRYAHACDRGDRELAKACYHPDATDDHGRVNGSVDAVFDYLARYSEGVASTWHFLGAPLILLDGDSADVETYCLYHREDVASGPDRGVLQGLRYVDRFERRNGTWAIAARIVVLDWEQELGPRPTPPAPDTWIRGTRGAADPASRLTPTLWAGRARDGS